MLTPLPGTIDFNRWEKETADVAVDGVPLTRYWLIPPSKRPKAYIPHPEMSADEVRRRTQIAWDQFYGMSSVWRRSQALSKVRDRLMFVMVSKLYRQMYANTGLATDSARVSNATKWARWMAKPLQRLFAAAPMPGLQVPNRLTPQGSVPLMAAGAGQPLHYVSRDSRTQ